MTPEQAAEALGIGPGTSEADRRAAHDRQRQAIEEKLASAPTPALKDKYRETLRRLEEADAVLAAHIGPSDLPQLKPDLSADVVAPAPAAVASATKAPAPAKRSAWKWISIVVVVLGLSGTGAAALYQHMVHGRYEQLLSAMTSAASAQDPERMRALLADASAAGIGPGATGRPTVPTDLVPRFDELATTLTEHLAEIERVLAAANLHLDAITDASTAADLTGLNTELEAVLKRPFPDEIRSKLQRRFEKVAELAMTGAGARMSAGSADEPTRARHLVAALELSGAAWHASWPALAGARAELVAAARAASVSLGSWATAEAEHARVHHEALQERLRLVGVAALPAKTGTGRASWLQLRAKAEHAYGEEARKRFLALDGTKRMVALKAAVEAQDVPRTAIDAARLEADLVALEQSLPHVRESTYLRPLFEDCLAGARADGDGQALLSLLQEERAALTAASFTVLVPDAVATPSAALKAATPGTLILVKRGTYPGHLVIPPGVCLMGEERGAVTISAPAVEGGVIEAVGANGGALINLTIEAAKGGDDPGPLLRITGGGVVVAGCRLSRAPGTGISFSGGGSAAVCASDIVDGRGWGITIDGTAMAAVGMNCSGNALGGVNATNAATLTISESSMERNHANGLLALGDGTTVTCRACTFAGNQENGILVDKGVTLVIVDSTARSNQASGIAVYGAGTTGTVRGNTCEKNQADGIQFAAGAGGSVERNVCRYNTNAGVWIATTATAKAIENKSEHNAHDR
jgi:hypothetical protein